MLTGIRRCLTSLLLAAAAAGAWCHDLTLEQKMERAATKQHVEKALSDAKGVIPAEDWNDLKRLVDEGQWQRARDSFPALRQTIRVRQAQPEGQVKDPGAEAKRILNDPRFRDIDSETRSNWLGDSVGEFFTRLGEWVAELLRRLFPQRDVRGPQWGILNPAPVVQAVIWILLIALGIFAVYFLVKMRFTINRRKKTIGGLLDESELERSADEWLTQADRLAAEGRHREAVRSLYVACLIRLDEQNVMRLERGETNWEHLRRFEKSPRRPAGLDFASATLQFDLVWYGFKVRGESDVAAMRSFYSQVLAAAAVKGAA